MGEGKTIVLNSMATVAKVYKLRKEKKKRIVYGPNDFNPKKELVPKNLFAGWGTGKVKRKQRR